MSSTVRDSFRHAMSSPFLGGMFGNGVAHAPEGNGGGSAGAVPHAAAAGTRVVRRTPSKVWHAAREARTRHRRGGGGGLGAAARAVTVRGIECIADVATGAVITTVDADMGHVLQGYIAYDSGYHVLNTFAAALSSNKQSLPLAGEATATLDMGVSTSAKWPLSAALNYSTAERCYDVSLCAALLGATVRAARSIPGRSSLKVNIPLGGNGGGGGKKGKGGGKGGKLSEALDSGGKKTYRSSLSATVDGDGDASLRLTPPRLFGGRLSFVANADGSRRVGNGGIGTLPRQASAGGVATTKVSRWSCSLKQRVHPFGARQAVQLSLSASVEDDFLPVASLDISSQLLPRNAAKWSLALAPGVPARHSLRLRAPRPRGARMRAEATLSQGALALDLGLADRRRGKGKEGGSVEGGGWEFISIVPLHALVRPMSSRPNFSASVTRRWKFI